MPFDPSSSRLILISARLPWMTPSRRFRVSTDTLRYRRQAGVVARWAGTRLCLQAGRDLLSGCSGSTRMGTDAGGLQSTDTIYRPQWRADGLDPELEAHLEPPGRYGDSPTLHRAAPDSDFGRRRLRVAINWSTYPTSTAAIRRRSSAIASTTATTRCASESRWRRGGITSPF